MLMAVVWTLLLLRSCLALLGDMEVKSLAHAVMRCHLLEMLPHHLSPQLRHATSPPAMLQGACQSFLACLFSQAVGSAVLPLVGIPLQLPNASQICFPTPQGLCCLDVWGQRSAFQLGSSSASHLVLFLLWHDLGPALY